MHQSAATFGRWVDKEDHLQADNSTLVIVAMVRLSACCCGIAYTLAMSYHHGITHLGLIRIVVGVMFLGRGVQQLVKVAKVVELFRETRFYLWLTAEFPSPVAGYPPRARLSGHSVPEGALLPFPFSLLKKISSPFFRELTFRERVMPVLWDQYTEFLNDRIGVEDRKELNKLRMKHAKIMVKLMGEILKDQFRSECEKLQVRLRNRALELDAWLKTKGY